MATAAAAPVLLTPRITPWQQVYALTGSKLGRGLSGDVLQVRQINTGTLFAMKVLPDNVASRREIDMHYRCMTSPYVVKIVDVFENEWQGKMHLLVFMEFLSGGELFDRIQEKIAEDSAFTEKEARSIFRQVCLAVQHIHALNIAHRDLKPENFLCINNDKVPQVKIIDFGFAKSSGEPLKTPVFTPYYVAPEVLNVRSKSAAHYDKSCDLWSLGVLLYILLSGCPPFFSYEQQQTKLTPGMEKRIKAADFDFDDDIWQDVSRQAKDLVARLLQPVPEQRMNIEEVLRHEWMNAEVLPETPLPTPNHLNKTEFWQDAKDELATALTSMRMGDGTALSLLPLDASQSSLLAKRKAQNQNHP